MKKLIKIINKYNKTKDEKILDELDDLQIASFEELLLLEKIANELGVTFDVKIHLNYGLYSRKCITEFSVFSYIDESRKTFRSDKGKRKYWDDYFNRHALITFDGFN